MSGEFKKYVRENNQDIKKAALSWYLGTVKSKLEKLFSGHPNVKQIKVPRDYQGTIFIDFESPLAVGLVGGSRRIPHQAWIKVKDAKGEARIGFSMSPGFFEELIPSGLQDIGKLYQALKYMIDDAEGFMIDKDPSNIQYLILPSKRTQQRVIDQNPRNIIYIKHPDPEIEKKYGHLKSLNKAGIL